MIIKGIYGEAKVFTDTIEDGAIEQITELLNLEAFKDDKIRIMPDVHQGVGCVIGFTAQLGKKIIPNIVGVDIGCGMLTVELGSVNLNLTEIDEFIHNKIPSGKAINEHKQYDYIQEIESLRCIRDIQGSSKQWNRAIGSLGGGNHFIEINIDNDGLKYLVIHSGSRNLGNQVANFYQKLAINYHNGLGDEYFEKRDEIIKTFKEQGRKSEIQKELEELKASMQTTSSFPNELCYLEGKLMDNYLHDMRICQRYAELNRETIANKILDFIFGHHDFKMFHTVHNYVDFEDHIVRKGAIKAMKSDLLLIPINMRDGSILAKGLGNPDWNFSAPHGAGRLYSRSVAKERITLEEFQKSMEGIFTTCVTESTIDESPMAYKSLDEIIENIKDSVEIISIIKPIYNFKA